MTAILAVVVIGGVGFGLYVSKERDSMVEMAEASIAVAKTRVNRAIETNQPIRCDNSLVEAEMLSNPFLSLSITRTLIDPDKGYGPSIIVSSSREADNNDTFVTTKRLRDAIKEKEVHEFRLI